MISRFTTPNGFFLKVLKTQHVNVLSISQKLEHVVKFTTIIKLEMIPTSWSFYSSNPSPYAGIKILVSNNYYLITIIIFFSLWVSPITLSLYSVLCTLSSDLLQKNISVYREKIILAYRYSKMFELAVVLFLNPLNENCFWGRIPEWFSLPWKCIFHTFTS